MAREYLFDLKPETPTINRGPQPVRLGRRRDHPMTGPEADRLIAEQDKDKDKVRTVTRRARRPAHGRFYLPEHLRAIKGTNALPAGRSTSGGIVHRAPVGVRPGHSYLKAVMTADSWVDSFLCPVRLACGPENIDLHRLESGLLSAPQDHNTALPFGRWTETLIQGGRLYGIAEIGRFKRAREISQEIREGVRHGFSIGFIVQESRLIGRQHPDYDPERPKIEISRYFPYECSSVSAPMIPAATLISIHGPRRS